MNGKRFDDPFALEHLDKIKVPKLREGETLRDYYDKGKEDNDWANYPIIGGFISDFQKKAEEYSIEQFKKSKYYRDLIDMGMLSAFLLLLFITQK